MRSLLSISCLGFVQKFLEVPSSYESFISSLRATNLLVLCLMSLLKGTIFLDIPPWPITLHSIGLYVQVFVWIHISMIHRGSDGVIVPIVRERFLIFSWPVSQFIRALSSLLIFLPLIFALVTLSYFPGSFFLLVDAPCALCKASLEFSNFKNLFICL